MSYHKTHIVVGYKEKMMNEIKEALADVDWYMTFHWWVLMFLWVICGIQLWNHEFGNVLCIAVAICAWKMKGVEE